MAYGKFTTQKVTTLEQHFEQSQHPEKETKIWLASQLGLDLRQVCTWFRSRRTRFKRELEKSKLENENACLKNGNLRLKAEVIRLKTDVLRLKEQLYKFEDENERLKEHLKLKRK